MEKQDTCTNSNISEQVNAFVANHTTMVMVIIIILVLVIIWLILREKGWFDKSAFTSTVKNEDTQPDEETADLLASINDKNNN